jgi:hypothetical protein
MQVSLVRTDITGVSIWVRLRGSQVSKARPGAPFDLLGEGRVG